MRLVYTFFKCGLGFFIFSQNFKKLTKKTCKKGRKVGCMFLRAVRAHE